MSNGKRKTVRQRQRQQRRTLRKSQREESRAQRKKLRSASDATLARSHPTPEAYEKRHLGEGKFEGVKVYYDREHGMSEREYGENLKLALFRRMKRKQIAARKQLKTYHKTGKGEKPPIRIPGPFGTTVGTTTYNKGGKLTSRYPGGGRIQHD